MFFSTDDVLRYWAATTPHSPSIRFEGVDISWQELNQRVARRAEMLRFNGVVAGNHVGVLLENRPEFIETVLALHRLGAVAVLINIRLAPAEVPGLLIQSDSTVLVTSAQFERHSEHVSGSLQTLVVLNIDASSYDDNGLGDVERPVGIYEPRPDNASELAYICFTSGTTGRPKGAELTHEGIIAGGLKIMLSDRLGHLDRSLLALPLAFTGSIAVIWNSAFLAGATLVLERHFEPELTLRQLEMERATVFYGVPFLYQEMARVPGFGSADLSALRIGRAAAAPVPVELLERWSQKGVPLSQGYGLTEGGACNLQLPLGREVDKRGAAGLPLLGGQTRVVNNGQDCIPGEVGELWLRGPEIMRGYYKNPKATEEALRDGWLRTGDLVTQDDEGFISIVDRKSDMIISGGLNVYPAEVEASILTVPGVVAAAVFGIPDEKWGESVAAVVVHDGASELDAADVISHCRSQIADYKVPRHVVVQTSDLPRNMAGKTLKGVLRDEFTAQGERASK